nr:uncharacterized protein LOC121126605 isoform X4 [Lepeophtheirus salmonis]
MGDLIGIVDGVVKYRDGKKWKLRYGVVTRLSPVADSLIFQLWKDRKDKERNCSPSKGSLVLENYFGYETGFTLDKESLTLAILFGEMVVVLAFNCREILMRWQIRISSQFRQGYSFCANLVLTTQKLSFATGFVKIYMQNDRFLLTAGIPPVSIHCWKLINLRRYGVLDDNQFVFEGGSQCGKGEGPHILRLKNPNELKNVFDLATKGTLHKQEQYSPKLFEILLTEENTFKNSGKLPSKHQHLLSTSSRNDVTNCSEVWSDNYSTSCDTMSDVLSEINLSSEETSERLVNRRTLLENIQMYAFWTSCDLSSKWNMKSDTSSPHTSFTTSQKEKKELQPKYSYASNEPSYIHTHDILIPLDVTSNTCSIDYDLPRTVHNNGIQNVVVRTGIKSSQDSNGSKEKYQHRVVNIDTGGNYDIPKNDYQSTLYDVPRSINMVKYRNYDIPISGGACSNLTKPDSCSFCFEKYEASKFEKMKLNGIGKMPVADMRNYRKDSPSEMSFHGNNEDNMYFNINYSKEFPQYENCRPIMEVSTDSPLKATNYDTINKKLRNFHDLLNSGEGTHSLMEYSICDSHNIKNRSFSSDSILFNCNTTRSSKRNSHDH